jgi:tripartite-type tricarboxylate transporter receptor subunit TctC
MEEKMKSQKLRGCLWSVGLLMFLVANVFAQGTAISYPEKPVRVISVLAVGGAVDSVGRMVATKLSENLQKQFIVENRSGGGGTIGYTYVAKAPKDGYTLLVAGSGYTMASVIYPVQYDPFKDIVPVAQVSNSSYLLVTHPALPAKTVKEFIALAKARPGALNYGSSGIGSATHFAMEIFAIAAGVNMAHIPYNSGQGQTDLISGEVQAMMANTIAVLTHVNDNRLRALGVSSSQRSPAMPNIPTIAESGIPFTRSGYTAFFAPSGVSPDIINKIQVEVAKAVKDPRVAKKIVDNGGEQTESIDVFRQTVRNELSVNRKIAVERNIKVM